MLRFYTPEEWASFFPKADLVIDDKGYIYDQKADTFLHHPIGWIDWESGKIYDKHYNDFMPSAIGIIKHKDGVTEVYGSNYNDFLAVPILFIKDERVYTHDEYYKFFSKADGYIVSDKKSDSKGTTTKDKADAKPESDTNVETKTGEDIDKTGEGFKWSDVSWIGWIGVILAVLFAIGSVVESFPLLMGNLDMDYGHLYTIGAWISVFVGVIAAALIGGGKYRRSIIVADIAMAITFIIASVRIDSKYGTDSGVVLDVVLGIFDVFTFIIPAIIVGLIVAKIMRIILKKEQQSKSSTKLFDYYVNEEIKSRNENGFYSFPNVIALNVKMVLKRPIIAIPAIIMIVSLVLFIVGYYYYNLNDYSNIFENTEVANGRKESFGEDVPNKVHLSDSSKYAILYFSDVVYDGKWQKKDNTIVVTLHEHFDVKSGNTYIFDIITPKCLCYAGYRYQSLMGVNDDYLAMLYCLVLSIVYIIGYYIMNAKLLRLSALESLIYLMLSRQSLNEKNAFGILNDMLVQSNREKINNEVYNDIVKKFLSLKLISIENTMIITKKKPVIRKINNMM